MASIIVSESSGALLPWPGRPSKRKLICEGRLYVSVLADGVADSKMTFDRDLGFWMENDCPEKADFGLKNEIAVLASKKIAVIISNKIKIIFTIVFIFLESRTPIILHFVVQGELLFFGKIYDTICSLNFYV